MGRRAIFRADASTAIGMGHVVRSLSLAHGLSDRGWQASLATRRLPAGLSAMVQAARVDVIELDRSVPSSDEARLLTVGRDALDLLVVDHYGIDQAWFASCGPVGATLAIDDLADRPLPVDLVLNPNLGIAQDAYARLVPPGTSVLIGPEFAPVRRVFAERRARGRARSGGVERVLVAFGGADQDDVTARAVAGLAGLPVACDVVVGAAYPHLDRLRELLVARPGVTLHVNIDDMEVVMDQADLVVGAPGSSSWERCTLALPTVLVVLAENQRPIERGLVDAGAAVSAGWHADVTPLSIATITSALLGDPARVAAMSRSAAAITDGHGTARVIEQVERAVQRSRASGGSRSEAGS